MAYVFAAPCVGVETGDCLEVCPRDCIYPGGEAGQHVIDPAGCIDRGGGAACPVEAIFPADEVPDEWMGFVRLNALIAAAVTGDRVPTTVGSLRIGRRQRWPAYGRGTSLVRASTSAARPVKRTRARSVLQGRDGTGDAVSPVGAERGREARGA